MGQDKALLELAQRPLVCHAVSKLHTVCADIHIVSSRSELEAFAPLIPDLHPGCGPLGGLEAALLHATKEWCLLLAVDMPFIPACLLSDWVQEIVADPVARVALFTVDGVPQPTLSMVHRECTFTVQKAMEAREYKLFPVLEGAGRELAARAGLAFEAVFVNRTDVDGAWFANLNTPEEFSAAVRDWDAGSR